jgi:hypothetical protein
MATFLPFVDSEEHDGIDFMAPTSPKVFFGNAPLKTQLQPDRRSLRPRQSLGNAIPKRVNRKRTLSMSASENNAAGISAKKMKMDEKKAVCFFPTCLDIV